MLEPQVNIEGNENHLRGLYFHLFTRCFLNLTCFRAGSWRCSVCWVQGIGEGVMQFRWETESAVIEPRVVEMVCRQI